MAENDILREHIATRSLGASDCDVITFRTIMIPGDRFLNVQASCRTTRGRVTKEAPTAEVVRSILCGLGLRSERTRKDTEGLVGLFRNLLSPPPWKEVEIEDIDGLTPARALELTPLYRLTDSEAELVEHYRQAERERSLQAQFLRDPLPEVISTVASLSWQFRLDDFVTKLRLARLLGPRKVEKLSEAIFGDEGDEFSAASGVPDLFVWDPDRQPAEWFFAEVKGPRDHLQESQTNWLRNHWKEIEGRFAVITIR